MNLIAALQNEMAAVEIIDASGLVKAIRQFSNSLFPSRFLKNLFSFFI